MLDTHLMVRTDNGTLQQAPNTLDSVCMNVANNPLLGRVINPLVFRVGVFNSPISWHFIRVDRFRIRRGIVADKLPQYALRCVWNYLQPNHAVALHRSDGD